MNLEFEPTNSFCYNFARYTALPEILQRPEVASGDDFRLIDVARAVIDRHLTKEQQAQKFVRPQVFRATPLAFLTPVHPSSPRTLTRLQGAVRRGQLPEWR